MTAIFLQKPKLLIVDDNLLYLQTVVAVLGEAYEVLTATDGETALALVASAYLPDLILLDVTMPGMDGHEVCRRLKAGDQTHDIPIIFLSGQADDDDQTKGLELGAVDYINKSSDFSMIKCRIKAHLELRQYREQLQQLVDQKVRELELSRKVAQEKDKLLQSILKSVPVAVGHVVDQKIMWFNESTTQITGYGLEELQGQSMHLLFPSDEAYVSVSDKYAEVQKVGFAAFDTVWKTKDDVNIDLNIRVTLLDKTNPDAGVIFVGLDITEQKLTQNALRDSEEYLRVLSDASFEAIFLSEKGICLGQNLTAEKMFGYHAGEAIGMPATTIIIPENHELVKAKMLAANEEPYEVIAIRKDGTTFPAEIQGRGLIYRGWQVRVTAVRDITKRKQAEIKRDQLLQAIDQTCETIVITNTDGTIEYVNPAFTTITGYSYAEAIGQNPRILKSGEHDNAFYADMWETLTCGMIWRGQLINKKKDGSTYIEDAVISPVLDSNDKIVNFVAVKRDVTEARQLQEEILKKTRLASLGELAAGVAHEINNPNALNLYNSDILATILNDLLPWLKENQPDSARLFGGLSYIDALDEFQTLLPAIQGSGLRIKRIVDDLRDFCRQEKADLNEVVDLNQVVNSSARLVGNIIKQATDHFKINLAESLPMISGVGGRLEQVIINLLLNSCQALDCRTQKISLVTKYVEKSNHVQVIIADEGCGMPAEIVDHILEPFVTTKRDQGGSGLGLSVSNRIVREHHGELQISSSVGQGTTIVMILPISQESDNVD